MKIILTLAIALLAANTGFSRPDPGTYTIRVVTPKQAEEVPQGAKLAFACDKCKTFEEKKDRTTFLGLFAKGTKHACGGCKGTVTWKDVGAKAKTAQYGHECSHCGAESAYACASHPAK